MFRMMLDSHPHIYCGPEFKVLPCLANWVKDRHEVVRQGVTAYGGTVSDFMRYLGASCEMYLNHAAQEKGKVRAAEKTPTNAIAWQGLRAMFPASPRINLVRNPYHVVASLLEQKWVNEDGEVIDNCRSAESAAEWWLNCTVAGQETGCYEVQYEQLCERPEEVLRGVCEYIDEPFDPVMLDWWRTEHDYPQSERVSHGEELSQPTRQRPARGLGDADRETVERICGRLAEQYGYQAWPEADERAASCRGVA
jgi:hypothetical protein